MTDFNRLTNVSNNELYDLKNHYQFRFSSASPIAPKKYFSNYNTACWERDMVSELPTVKTSWLPVSLRLPELQKQFPVLHSLHRR